MNNENPRSGDEGTPAMKKGCGVVLGVLALLYAAYVAMLNYDDPQLQKKRAAAGARIQLQRQVAGIILAHYERRGKPPARLEDLEPFAEQFPKGYRALTEGKWAVRWNLPVAESHRLSGNRDRVLAYQRCDPEGRSWVIFGDGSISLTDDDQLDATIEASDILHGIFDMYMAYLKHRSKPPRDKRDLEPFAADNKKAYEAIGDSRWVVQWGTTVGKDPRENSGIVLAYGRKVLNDVGFILAADGVVYVASEDEFPGWLQATGIARQIAAMHLEYHRQHKKPPMAMEDFQAYAEQYPEGYRAVKEGRWFVLWGTEISQDPKVNRNRLLAYDRQLPVSDDMHPCWAVFADASSCQVTAAEFRDKSWERYEYQRLYKD